MNVDPRDHLRSLLFEGALEYVRLHKDAEPYTTARLYIATSEFREATWRGMAANEQHEFMHRLYRTVYVDDFEVM